MHWRRISPLVALCLLGIALLASLLYPAYADTGPTSKRSLLPSVTIIPSPAPSPTPTDGLQFRLTEAACFSGSIAVLFSVDALKSDINLLAEPWTNVKYSVDGMAREANLSLGFTDHMEFLDYIPSHGRTVIAVDHAVVTVGAIELALENAGPHPVIPCPTS